MRWIATVSILVVSALLCSSCAFTKMETARQLEAGETVVSGSLDWPGFALIPRANANAIYGLGNADISAHLGTTLFSGNAGIGGRLYLTDRFILSLQADAMTLFADFELATVERFERVVITATPRLTTAVQQGELVYGGVQANAFSGWQRADSTYDFFGVAGGVLIGVDHYITHRNLGFQAEFIIHPIGFTEGEITFIGGTDSPVVAQFSIGMYFR